VRAALSVPEKTNLLPFAFQMAYLFSHFLVADPVNLRLVQQASGTTTDSFQESSFLLCICWTSSMTIFLCETYLIFDAFNAVFLDVPSLPAVER